MNGAARIEQFTCPLQADHPRQRIEQVAIRHRPDLAERRVETGPLGRKNDVAGQRQTQTRAICRAIDCDDDRHLQVAQQRDPAMQILHPGQDIFGPHDQAGLVVGQHLFQIAPRAKHAA